MSAPVLAYPDPNREYLLETDASRLGLGAVLSQRQSDGKYHPVAFGSRTLHGAEVNYHSTRLEFLAMKWSIKHFRCICWDVTSKSALITAHSRISLHHLTDAMKQRWIIELAKYDFSLEYQKGKNNTVADESRKNGCLMKKQTSYLNLSL